MTNDFDLDPTARLLADTLNTDPPPEVESRMQARLSELRCKLDLADGADQTPRLRYGSQPRLVRWTAVTSAIAAAIAIAVLIGLPFTSPAFALAEALDAAKSRPWIHGVTQYVADGKSATAEFWYSAAKQEAGLKFGDTIVFEDLRQLVTLKYEAASNTVYRVRREAMPLPTASLDLLISDPKSSAAEAFHGERIVKSQRRIVDEGGTSSIEYVVHLERIGNPTMWRTLIVRAAADTKLPLSMEERHSNGTIASTRFDYPVDGPADIYALGVPRTAKLVDRLPGDRLERIIAAHKADRHYFDDYDAIVVTSTVGAPTDYVKQPMNLQLERVRRKGKLYRVDQLLAAKPGLAAPKAGADMRAWWIANRDNYWSVPKAIFDGKTLSIYLMLNDRIGPNEKPNLSVTLINTLPARLPLDDSPVEWPQLMPEYFSRPHLWTSDESRKIEMAPAADADEQSTIQVVVSRSSGQRAGELFRYWFDPMHGQVLQKSIATVFDPKTDEVAYLDTEVFEDLAQSPSGRWYPRRVVRTTSANKDWTGVTNYYLDFEGKLPDELFRPLDDK